MSTSSQILPSHPLNLHMSTVTHAVEDIISGYESLVHTLPELSMKIKTAHQETEGLVDHLQKKTENLVADYAYVSDISNQIPSLLGKTAENYKNNLLTLYKGAPPLIEPNNNNTRTRSNYLQLITDEEEESIKSMSKRLDEMRDELQSLSHQRTVVEVLTRPIINDFKKSVKDYTISHPPPRFASNYNTKKELKEKDYESLDLNIQIPEYNPPNMLQKYKKKELKNSSNSYNFDTTSSLSARTLNKESIVVPAMHNNSGITKNVNQSPAFSSANQRKKKSVDANLPQKIKPTISSKPISPVKKISSAPVVTPVMKTEELIAPQPSNVLIPKNNNNNLSDNDVKKLIENILEKERKNSDSKINFLFSMFEKNQQNHDHVVLNVIDDLIHEVVDSFSGVLEDLDILKFMDEIVEKILPLHNPVPIQPIRNEIRPERHSHHFHHHLHACLPNEDEIVESVDANSSPIFPSVELVDHSLQVDIPEVCSQEQQTEPIVLAEEREIVEADQDIQSPIHVSSTQPQPPTQIININHPPLEQSLLQVISQVVQSQQGQQALLLSLIQSLNERKEKEEMESIEKEEKVIINEVVPEIKIVMSEIGIQTDFVEEEKVIERVNKVQEEEIDHQEKVEEIEEDESNFRSNIGSGLFKKNKNPEDVYKLEVPIQYLKKNKNSFNDHNKYASNLTSIYLKKYKDIRDEEKKTLEVEKIEPVVDSNINNFNKEFFTFIENIIQNNSNISNPVVSKKEEVKSNEFYQMIQTSVTNCVREALGYVLESPHSEPNEKFFYDPKNNLVHNSLHLEKKRNVGAQPKVEKFNEVYNYELDNDEEELIEFKEVKFEGKTKGEYKMLGRDINQYSECYNDATLLTKGEMPIVTDNLFDITVVNTDKGIDLKNLENEMLKSKKNIKKLKEGNKPGINTLIDNEFSTYNLINVKSDLSFNDSISLDEEFTMDFDRLKYDKLKHLDILDEDDSLIDENLGQIFTKKSFVKKEKSEEQIYNDDEKFIKEFEKKKKNAIKKEERKIEKISQINPFPFVPLVSNVLDNPLSKNYEQFNQQKLLIDSVSTSSSSSNSNFSDIDSILLERENEIFHTKKALLQSSQLSPNNINNKNYTNIIQEYNNDLNQSTISSSTISSSSYRRPSSNIEKEKRKKALIGVNSKISTDEIDINKLRSLKYLASTGSSYMSSLFSDSIELVSDEESYTPVREKNMKYRRETPSPSISSSSSSSNNDSSVSSYNSFTVLNKDDVSLLNSLDDSIYKSKSSRYSKNDEDSENESFYSEYSSSFSNESFNIKNTLKSKRNYKNDSDEDSYDSSRSQTSNYSPSISSSNELVNLNFNIPILGLKNL